MRNFLDCVKSREQPVENLEVGHFVSTVAHLGNLACRSGEQVTWDAKNERVIGNKQANRLLNCPYRKPWKLPRAQGRRPAAFGGPKGMRPWAITC